MHFRKHEILLYILLLPLFIIGVGENHNWGDDFAQYLLQARNILEDRPQSDNGIVFDPAAKPFAVPAYPAGLPLLLAGSWAIFGFSFSAFKIVITVFLFAFGVLAYRFLVRTLSPPVGILLVLLILYNPWTLDFKNDVLSEIPFSFFLLLGIFLYEAKNKRSTGFVLTGMIFGLAASIRGPGFILFLAVIFYELMIYRQRKKEEPGITPKQVLKKPVIIMIASALTFIFINVICVSVPSGSLIRFYSESILDKHPVSWPLLNLKYYFEVFQSFFSTVGGSFSWIAFITRHLMVLLIAAGYILSFARKPGLGEWFVLIYFLGLLFYPYSNGGFRFLFPLVPFMVKYIGISAGFILEKIKVKSTYPLPAFLIFILVLYFPGVREELKEGRSSEEGPLSRESRMAFQYIRDSVPPNAVIAFKRPRALSLFTGRKATTGFASPPELEASFVRTGTYYFLLNAEPAMEDLPLKDFLESQSSQLTLVWQNNSFKLYADLDKSKL